VRRLILMFLVVIAAGGATGATASDGGIQPPSLPSDVTCTRQADTMTCFYPAHDAGRP
jgi:hypothetical protein